MSPKSQEKPQQQQQQQQQQLLNKHSKSFYISAHGLCHNKHLKLKRRRWLQAFNKMQERNKPDIRNTLRKQVMAIQAVETIDLLSDDDDDYHSKVKNQSITNNKYLKNNISCEQQQQLPQLINTNGLSTSYITNNIANYINISTMTLPQPPQPPQPPTLPPLVPMLSTAPMHVASLQQQAAPQSQPSPVPLPPLLQIPVTTVVAPMANNNSVRKGKRKASKPRKRIQMQNRTLECSESIVLSDTDDSGNNNNNNKMKFIEVDMNGACLEEQNISQQQQQQNHNNHHHHQQQHQMLQSHNSIQVDEVTVSLIPCNYKNRNLSASWEQNTLNTVPTEHTVEQFPMVPDETTVQTVIANRTYELSLTKLREGLASCGIPEFADNSLKTNTPKKKNTALPPELYVTPPQQPISLKLSNNLSISLISDDDDDDYNDNGNDNYGTHTNGLNKLTENSGVVLSTTLLQKLPLNVSIAPIPKNWPFNALPKRKLG